MTITMTEEQFEEAMGRARGQRNVAICTRCGETVNANQVRDGICSMCRIFDVGLVVRDEDPDEAWPEEDGEVAGDGQGAGGGEG